MTKEKETVYLVDGSSYIHRAYHAIRHLANSKGFPTNAAYGFVQMILKLFSERRPKYAAIVFDAKGPTFRHKLYKDYKATRPPMPDDLVVQLPYIKRIVRGLNVPMIEREGVEADDVIGTLARLSEEEGHDVVIVTGDKDFRQILSGKVSLWDTMRDRITDCDSFREEYGFQPVRVIDMMGLSGDPSDNVPGVPGVGEKTAAGLIRQFGTLEKVYEHLEEVKGKKLKENLEKARDDAVLSKRLVTIDRFVPIDQCPGDMRVGDPDRDRLSEIFRELEFRGLWEKFAAPQTPSEKDYRLCLDEASLVSLVARIKEKGMVSVDTETTSEDPMRAELVGVSLSWEEGRAYYLPLAHRYPGAPRQVERSRALEILEDILEDEKIAKIGQNVKYDALVFRNHGVELKGIRFDTMIASYVINPGLRQHNLDTLAQHYLNHRMIAYKDVVGKGKQQRSFAEVEVEAAKDYACEDADTALTLMGVLEKRLESEKNQDLFRDLEMRLLPVLMDMEFAGIGIDVPFFEEMSSRFLDQLRDIEEDIYEEAGMEFNINSPQQLGYVLFEKLQLPVQKKTSKTKAYSTDMKVLKRLSSLPYRIPKLLLRYRTLSKLKSTYLDALIKMVHPRTGRIHTSFNQTVTATGRLSSSSPNLQNIPIRGEEGREIRKGFVARDGFRLLSSDYSQIELRVFAHYSSDPAFMEAFRRGEDIHARTASEIMGVGMGEVTPEMRRIAKAINFGIIYGMGPQKLGEELGIDLKTARNYISTYYERYRGVERYRDETIAAARKEGFVTTLFNRRRYLPDINHKNPIIRGEAERMAINTPIQGTAADLIKMAMIRIHGRLKRESPDTSMLLQVHDELVIETPEKQMEAVSELVREEMEGVHKLTVPLVVEIKAGVNWDEAH
ncbi:MAG: DNA polymerase I [Deltaproteobacteria bacterium]|nr:DNA polymerase I [Deltaproteobacteria bacterium]